MKKAIAAMAVLATSLLLAVSVGAANAVNKVDAKGAVTDMLFGNDTVPGPPTGFPYPSGSPESITTGKWHVKSDWVMGKFEAKFDFKSSFGKVKITSVMTPTTSATYAGGVLTVSGLRFTVTTDGPLKGKDDTTVGADICGQVKVDTNTGTMELNINRCAVGMGPTNTTNLKGTAKDVKLKY